MTQLEMKKQILNLGFATRFTFLDINFINIELLDLETNEVAFIGDASTERLACRYALEMAKFLTKRKNNV